MTLPKSNLATLRAATGKYHLDIVGIARTNPDDPVPDGTQSIVLLGPKEPGYWAHVTAQPEFHDNHPDPVDRWSMRTMSALATELGGTAVFPFGPPPYAPFIAWAIRSGRAWPSPIGMLVHDVAGLFISLRGAICLPAAITDPPTSEKPCKTCATRACLTACPVGALSADGYNLESCHQYLDTSPGRDCMEIGCAARRACPVSQTYERLPIQSAHHMKAFHK